MSASSAWLLSAGLGLPQEGQSGHDLPCCSGICRETLDPTWAKAQVVAYNEEGGGDQAQNAGRDAEPSELAP